VKNFKIIAAIVCIAIVVIFFINAEKIEPKDTVEIGDAEVSVTYADTPELQSRGLSGVKSLESDEGMFFVFEKPDKYGFWMKDMLFPIDIVWIDDSLHVIDVTKSLSPDTYPKIFTPQTPVKYVLEVRAGFFDEHKLQIGDEVKI
jgi:uncharacterized membrane protein (UPF0127 family)